MIHQCHYRYRSPWLVLFSLLFWTTLSSSSYSSFAWEDISSVVPKSTTRTNPNDNSDNNQMIASEGGGLRIIRSNRPRDLSSSTSDSDIVIEISQECKHESNIIQQSYIDIVSEYKRLNDVITQTPFQNFCIQTEDALSCTIPYRQFFETSTTSSSTIKDICLSKNNNNNPEDTSSSTTTATTVETAISTIYVESNIQLDCKENGSTTRLKSVNIPSCISSKCNIYDIENYVNQQLNIMKETLSTSQALQCTGYYDIKLEGGTSTSSNNMRSSSTTTSVVGSGRRSMVLILTTISITTILLCLLSFTNILF